LAQTAVIPYSARLRLRAAVAAVAIKLDHQLEPTVVLAAAETAKHQITPPVLEILHQPLRLKEIMAALGLVVLPLQEPVVAEAVLAEQVLPLVRQVLEAMGVLPRPQQFLACLLTMLAAAVVVTKHQAPLVLVAEHQPRLKKAVVVMAEMETVIPAPLELLTPEAAAAVAIRQVAQAVLVS
jgi:hypothetical protein